VKVAIRMGPPSLRAGGRLGWLKWREFGRRGKYSPRSGDPGVEKRTWNSNVRWLWHPVGRTPKQVPTDTPAAKAGRWREGKRHASDL
jgi:hypothetical protein